MGISTNSVIHFTSLRENLEGIIKNGFKVKYCLEENRVKSGKISAAVPMVSFCDIPLSEIKNHISRYGYYGIGLKKEWAVKNGLNPVLYIECNSLLGESIRAVLMNYTVVKDPVTGRTLEQKQLMDVARYIKNYQRDLIRNGKVEKDYRFYDEREWRFVPDLKYNPIVVHSRKYKDVAYKNKINEDVGKIKLQFSPNDISYIILKDDSEISEFIDFLRRCFKKTTTSEDIDTLITRIITTNHIKNDF